MKKKYLLVMIALALCAPSIGFTQESKEEKIKSFEAMFPTGEPSEEDVYRADRLLISATGSQKPVHLAPSVATVITAEDIEKMGATTLDEVLETVPGLHVAPSGLNISSSIWSIRGMRTSSNPQVLLLLNGIPINEVVNGGRLHRYNMSLSMISRVEVVRGPGSAIHGADAFTGTINVITKDGHEIEGTRVGIRYGSFDSRDGWLQYGGIHGEWNVAAGIEASLTDGDDSRIIDQDALGSTPPSLAPGPLDSRHEQMEINLAANKNDRWIGRFHGSWVDNTGMGSGGIQILNGNQSTIKNSHYLLDLTYNNDDLVSDLALSLQGTYLYQRSENHFLFFPTTVANMIGEPVGTLQTSGLEAVGKYSHFIHHALRFSVGMKYYDMETDEYKNFGPGISDPLGTPVSVKGTPNIFLDNQYRNLWYFSAQDEWSLARAWTLTAGVRYDEYSDFGSTVNPRLAMVWETTTLLTSKLMYGRAFRAPSFAEQYIQANPVNRGNPNLDPETIDTYELAFDWQPTKDMRIVPSVFYYKINDLIEYVGALPSQAENNGIWEGHGFEVEADWQILDSLQLKANLAYQRSEDTYTDELIADTPEWQFYTEANWAFLPEWNLNGQWFWIGKRHRAEADPRPDIADYNLFNLTLKRSNIIKHWDVSLSARNIFDEDAREPSPYDANAPAGAFIPNDYPMEGRMVSLEIQYKF